MATPKKEATVEELRDMLSRSSMTVVADYRGLKVADLQALRTTLRSFNGEARVAKNTLTSIAAEQAGKQGLVEHLQCPSHLEPDEVAPDALQRRGRIQPPRHGRPPSAKRRPTAA